MKKSIPKNKMSKINHENKFDAHNLEHLNKILTYNQKSVRIFGTNEDPWFCGRDVCEILEYSDYRRSLFDHVEDENKKSLKDLGVGVSPIPKISHNEGQMCYINEAGLYSILSACKHPNSKPFKAFMDQFFYDLRYKSGIMDIFAFIKDKKVAIDVNSPWFQELWYPISKKQHSLLTMLLLEWMGYAGEYFTQKQNFIKLLHRNKIPYEEISHTDSRFLEHPVMIREIKQTGANNLEKKKWLVMEIRNFKKAVMRLNTKSGEIVRDYYLNLEEACFEYAEYQAAWLAEKAEMERKIADEKLAKQMAMLSIKDKELKNKDKELEQEAVARKQAEQDKEQEREAKEQEREAKEQALQDKEKAEVAQKKAERKALNVQKFMNRITVREHKPGMDLHRNNAFVCSRTFIQNRLNNSFDQSHSTVQYRPTRIFRPFLLRLGYQMLQC
jgi:hypothetical protein